MVLVNYRMWMGGFNFYASVRAVFSVYVYDFFEHMSQYSTTNNEAIRCFLIKCLSVILIQEKLRKDHKIQQQCTKASNQPR